VISYVKTRFLIRLLRIFYSIFPANLQQATTCLSELDQSPSASILESMQPFLNAIVKPELLKHQDRDVKLLVATCICEITRITAPEAPYSDDVLKVCFFYTGQLVNEVGHGFHINPIVEIVLPPD
jgi:hypothetical protein